MLLVNQPPTFNIQTDTNPNNLQGDPNAGQRGYTTTENNYGTQNASVITVPLRIDALGRGELPFYEPGLAPLLQSGLKSGRLSFSTSYAEAAAFGDVHFICVGTPQQQGSRAADLSQVRGCLDELAPRGPDHERP